MCMCKCTCMSVCVFMCVCSSVSLCVSECLCIYVLYKFKPYFKALITSLKTTPKRSLNTGILNNNEFNQSNFTLYNNKRILSI